MNKQFSISQITNNCLNKFNNSVNSKSIISRNASFIDINFLNINNKFGGIPVK